MEITGRVTADAVVQKVGEKEVLGFSIAINDRYKPAGSDEFKQVTTFINCSYWIAVNVGQWVKKGAVVLLSGRLGMHVYINNDGNPAGSIDFHVNTINIIAFAKRNGHADADTDVDTDGRAGTDADTEAASAAEQRNSKLQRGNGRTTLAGGKGNSADEVPF